MTSTNNIRFLRHLVASTSILVGCLVSIGWSQIVIFENNFDDDPTGLYTRANLNADWNSPSSEDGITERRVSIVDGADAFSGNSLAVEYPAGQHRPQETGGQWRMQLGGSYNEVFCEYRVKFGEGFDFVRGGKLPGLNGGVGNVGGDRPDGTDGFSARMHWRTDGSAGSPLRDTGLANMTQYLYHPDQPTDFGDDMRWDDSDFGDWEFFESGRWYHLRHRVVMNTVVNGVGQHDGIVQGWLDGELVFDVRNIRFRDVTTFAIEGFHFSTFFGGTGSQWNTSKDEVAFFDDFVISIPDPNDTGGGDTGGGDTGGGQTGEPSTSVVVNDSFTDGDRSITGNSGSDIEANFYSTSNSSAIEDNVDDGIGTGRIGLVSGTSGRQIHTVFPSQTLAIAGDSITAEVTFVTPQVVASNFTQAQFDALDSAIQDGASVTFPANGDDLRIGLLSTSTRLNNNGNLGLNEDVLNSESSPIPALSLNGYAIELDVESAVSGNSTDLNVREYLVSSGSGRLLGTNTGTTSVATDSSTGLYIFQPNTEYSVHQTYRLNDFGGLDVSVEFLQGATSIGTLNFTDSSPATLEFGTLALGASSEAFGLSNDPGDPSNGIDITNVTINFVTLAAPAVLKGDVDLNGTVNFLDIPAFIGVLQSGGFQAEADCDCSEVVNFLDIPAFIGTLQGS